MVFENGECSMLTVSREQKDIVLSETAERNLRNLGIGIGKRSVLERMTGKPKCIFLYNFHIVCLIFSFCKDKFV